MIHGQGSYHAKLTNDGQVQLFANTTDINQSCFQYCLLFV